MRRPIPRPCYEREKAATMSSEVTYGEMTAEEYEYHFGTKREFRDSDGKVISAGFGLKVELGLYKPKKVK